jgi:acyl carrier protein
MDELLTFLKNTFPLIDFHDENNLIKDSQIDSIDLLNLIDALEGRYSITIPMEDITLENFNSIPAIHSLICRLR